MNINKIMSISPYLEVLIRNLYWRIPLLISNVNKNKKANKSKGVSISSRQFIKHLEDSGVGKGDIAIIHSSYQALKADNESPEIIIRKLLSFVGENGTLAMPAIPYFSEAPKITERMTADVSKLVLNYDPINTPAWTGVLPNTLMRFPGAIRSLHPLNTMVAIGHEAREMMADNIVGDRPLPCGLSSSWHYCFKKNAKIIAVGADLAHSLTMIHVAEDILDENWVVKNWYRERKFKILDNVNKFHGCVITVRERHPKWAMHYAERTLSIDLIKKGLTIQRNINGVNIEIINAKPLIDYLMSRNEKGYPYYLVPLKKTNHAD